MRVTLLVTCLTDTFYPRAAIAVVRVLEKLGCAVDFPTDQTCCGQPMFNNGCHCDARDLASRTIELFRDHAHVVTPSGSCCAMIRREYPRLFADDPAMRRAAEDLAARTREFSEFLLDVLHVDLRRLGARWNGAVTAHEACHGRTIGLTGRAAALLRQIEGLDYQPLEWADQCCGFGGTFALKFPEVSGELVRDKTEAIRRTGAAVCVSSDAGCTLNLAGGCRRAGCDVAFSHLAEIIADSLGLMGRGE